MNGMRKRAIRRAWYRARYGITISRGLNHGTMMPQLGDGQFVAVRQRGPFLDITDKRTGEMIRLVPYQPNHGVMVEYWPTPDRLSWRSHCDIGAFKRMGFGSQEVTSGD